MLEKAIEQWILVTDIVKDVDQLQKVYLSGFDEERWAYVCEYTRFLGKTALSIVLDAFPLLMMRNQGQEGRTKNGWNQG